MVYVALSRVIFNTLFNIIHVCRSQYVLQNFIFSDLGNFQSKVFISYFSYHKPIVSFLEYDTIDHESEENLPESFMHNYHYIYIVNVTTV